MTPQPYPVPVNEEQRLRALAEYHLMDTPPEKEFDRLVEFAARTFKVPTVLISLLERDRQFFKARVGLDVCETSRDISFCAHAILQADVLVVPDATEDPRFRANPLVVGMPNIRFYAGAPLVTHGGDKVGTLCLIDDKPRWVFSAEDRQNLLDLAAMAMDRMEMHRLEFVRSVSQSRFRNIASTSPDAIICSDAEARITSWNPAAEQLFGFSSEEAIGQPIGIIVPPRQRQFHDDDLQRIAEGGGLGLVGNTVELPALRRNGTEFPAEFSFSTWREGTKPAFGAIIRDITERRATEERLYHMASRDGLTGLPNRVALSADAALMLHGDGAATLLLLDLDGFKDVNDTLGHSAGDQMLRMVAERIRRFDDRGRIVARLGGDEFVVLLPGNNPIVADRIAEGLLAAITEPFDLDGERIEISVSIGVAFAPFHGRTANELHGAADLALYLAKTAGRGRYEVFTVALKQAAIARRIFEQELRRAHEQKEFELYYQPQIRLNDGTLTGAEALLRWNHPVRGLLTPAAFLDTLNGMQLAASVGDWVLNTASTQTAVWRDYHPEFRMGINLFGHQFRSGDLVASVSGALSQNNLPPEAVELEITENILLQQDEVTIDLLKELRKLGIGLAFDDYGTGFASLSLLKRFPITRLKIDKSFVRDVCSDPENAAVVRAIIYLGRSFDLEIIAEGVETVDQREFLQAENCSEAQGYLFGHPMRAGPFERLYLRHRFDAAGGNPIAASTFRSTASLP